MNTCTFGIEIEQDVPVTPPDHWSSKYDGSVISRIKTKYCDECGYTQATLACFCYSFSRHCGYNPNCIGCRGSGRNVCTNHNGMEAPDFTTEHVSPVIRGKNAFEQEMLNSIEWAVNDTNHSCGLHVHIGHEDVNLAELADNDDEFHAMIIDLNNKFYSWVTDNDWDRADNEYCIHRPTVLAWRRGNRRYGTRRGEVGCGSCVLRNIGTIEFRSPSPRIDRQGLADQINLIATKIEEYIDEKNLSVR